jgi:hypothetical protein
MRLQSSELTVLSCTIASGQADSSAIAASDLFCIGVILPAAWTSAGIGFAHSLDGVTYHDVYDDDGVVIKAQADAGRMIVFVSRPVPVKGSLQLRSVNASTGADVNQAADRALSVLFMP